MTMKTYLFEYDFDGRTYGFDVVAGSIAEAKEHVKRMCFGRYQGELVATIPAYGAGPIVRVLTGIRKLLG